MLGKWEEREAELLQKNAQLDERAAGTVQAAEAIIQENGHASSSFDTLDFNEDYESNCTRTAASPRVHRATERSHRRRAREQQQTGERVHSSDHSERYTGSGDLEELPPPFEDLLDSNDEHGELSPPAPGGMGVEATLRFQQAQLKVLKEELEAERAYKSEQEKEYIDIRMELSKSLEAQKRLSKQLHNAEGLLQKEKQVSKEAKKGVEELRTELQGLQRELQETRTTKNVTEKEGHGKNVRLNRALEEIEKQKAIIRDLKSSTKGDTSSSKKETERLEVENKRLEKQKTELLNAFKKQLKLIDILKRQKVHMEAARLLAFSEEEFTKALSLPTGQNE